MLSALPSSSPQDAQDAAPRNPQGEQLGSGLRLAYLVNQYPQPSQTFIRREIVALEAAGARVERFTLRATDTVLVDPADVAERGRTRAILSVGSLGLLLGVARVAMLDPVRLLRTFKFAVTLGRRSDRGVVRQLIYLAEACVLLRWLKAAEVRHLHAHFGTNSTSVAMYCRLLGGPAYSFTVHGPEEFDKPEFIHLREKVRHAAFAVAISSFGRSQIYRWIDHGDWPKVQIIRCGLDGDFLNMPARPPSAEPRLVCVARLEPQKGIELLIQAIGRLAAEEVPVHLTLIGDGVLRSTIEALIDQLKLQDHVLLLGWQSNADVRKALLEARGLVLPSFAEGLPVVIMESLAMRRPVISTYVGGNVELVEPGVCGWLTPAGSLEPLVVAIRALLAAPVAEIMRMGTAGAERVAVQHNASLEARRLCELFRRSLPAASSRG